MFGQQENRNFINKKGLTTNQQDVLIAEKTKKETKMEAEEETEDLDQGKCTKLHVPIAVQRILFLSSQKKAEKFFVATAFKKQDNNNFKPY